MITKQLLKQFCIHYNARDDQMKRAGLLDWMRRFGSDAGSVQVDVANQIAIFNSQYRGTDKIPHHGNDKIADEIAVLVSKAFEQYTRQ
jgi:hypothetical protein